MSSEHQVKFRSASLVWRFQTFYMKQSFFALCFCWLQHLYISWSRFILWGCSGSGRVPDPAGPGRTRPSPGPAAGLSRRRPPGGRPRLCVCGWDAQAAQDLLRRLSQHALHVADEAVDVAFARRLVDDVFVVVVAQAAAQLLIVHLWLVLALTPALGHLQEGETKELGWIMNMKMLPNLKYNFALKGSACWKSGENPGFQIRRFPDLGWWCTLIIQSHHC